MRGKRAVDSARIWAVERGRGRGRGRWRGGMR